MFKRSYWTIGDKMAGPTRLELATSGVTGRRSNQTELRPRKGITIIISNPLAFQQLSKIYTPQDKSQKCII